MNPLKVISVSKINLPIYNNLAQCYEAEFSPLTQKKPNAEGLFELDTQLGETITGFILDIDDIPAGIAAISQKENNGYEMCEFYVVPYFRRSTIGMQFAHMIWSMYPGQWEIKQIEGAEYATAFWRRVIEQFNTTPYTEEQVNDLYWGNVTRQKFTTI